MCASSLGTVLSSLDTLVIIFQSHTQYTLSLCRITHSLAGLASHAKGHSIIIPKSINSTVCASRFVVYFGGWYQKALKFRRQLSIERLYRAGMYIIELSDGLALDVSVDNLGEVLSLRRRNGIVELDGLAATVTGSDGTGTVRAGTVNLVQVGLFGKISVTEWNVIDTMVNEEGDGGEVSGLVTTVLGSGRGESGGKFADEGTGSPKPTCAVEERRNLSRGASITCGEAKDEAVVLLECVGSNDGVL